MLINQMVPALQKRVVAVVLVAAALLLALPAAAARADRYWVTGAFGPSFDLPGTCKFNDAWGTLDISVKRPEVYARNNTPGGGNDSQWVRYRTFLVNASGATIASNGWSEWRVAYDVSIAPFSQGQRFTNVPSGSRIDIRVEWWNSTSMLGAAAHRTSTYVYYRGQQGPIGPINSCAVVY